MLSTVPKLPTTRTATFYTEFGTSGRRMDGGASDAVSVANRDRRLANVSILEIPVTFTQCRNAVSIAGGYTERHGFLQLRIKGDVNATASDILSTFAHAKSLSGRVSPAIVGGIVVDAKRLSSGMAGRIDGISRDGLQAQLTAAQAGDTQLYGGEIKVLNASGRVGHASLLAVQGEKWNVTMGEPRLVGSMFSEPPARRSFHGEAAETAETVVKHVPMSAARQPSCADAPLQVAVDVNRPGSNIGLAWRDVEQSRPAAGPGRRAGADDDASDSLVGSGALSLELWECGLGIPHGAALPGRAVLPPVVATDRDIAVNGQGLRLSRRIVNPLFEPVTPTSYKSYPFDCGLLEDSAGAQNVLVAGSVSEETTRL